MRYNTTLVYMAAMLFMHTAMAQAPALEWQKSLGGTMTDWAYSIQQTSDGGYIVAGSTKSDDGDVTGNKGGTDVWVVKLTTSGSIEWQRALGGSGEDEATCIIQTSDGGYILAGSSSSFDGDIAGDNNGGYDAWVVKLNDTGGITWAKSYGGNGDEYAYAVCETAGGGYLVTGSVPATVGDYDLWVIKLAANGAPDGFGELITGGTDYEAGHSIQETADGGFIIAGHAGSNDGDISGNHGGSDFWILKFSSTGTLQWSKCHGGSFGETAVSLKQTTDGGYIVAGYTISGDGDVSGLHGDTDMWVVKLTGAGNITWQKCLGGSNYDRAASIHPTPDGGYIAAGFTLSTDGDVSGNSGGDYWVVKLTGTGDLSWQKCLGGTGSESAAYSIYPTMDGGYIVAGVAQGNSGDITGNHGGYDFWIVKLESETAGTDPINDTKAIAVYPNPAAGMVTIAGIPAGTTVSITDLTGKLVFHTMAGQEQLAVSTAGFVNGLYLIRAENAGRISWHKLAVHQ